MNNLLIGKYQDFVIREWQASDRLSAANIMKTVLPEYGLVWEPEAEDQDLLAIEVYYQQTGGEFWVVEYDGQIVGTGGYYPSDRGHNAVELKKMYLLREYRGRGLGQFLLTELEKAITRKNFQEIWIQTASILVEAINLYEKFGYQQRPGIGEKRCDRIYYKLLTQNQSSL